MKRTDIAYLAGVIDSDGCIQVIGRRYAKSGRVYYMPRITLKQVTPEATSLAGELFGGHCFLEKPSAPSRRPLYRWELSATAAVPTLRALLPYLRIKRAQAENALALAAAREKLERRGVPRGQPILTVEYQELLASFKQRALELNRVGHVPPSP